MEPRVEIVNIVATVKLEPMPEPNRILERIPGARPLRRFRGALLRIDRIPVLFYKKKIVVTGIKSAEELDSVVIRLINILSEHGFSFKTPESREVVNITLKAELHNQLDLYDVADKLGGIYDPDYRPYAVVKINNLTILVSQRGRIVVLGAKRVDEAINTINVLIEKLTMARGLRRQHQVL